MRRGSRLATRRWRASISRATSSTRSGTTPSLHARHNTPHVALNCACVLSRAEAIRTQESVPALSKSRHEHFREHFLHSLSILGKGGQPLVRKRLWREVVDFAQHSLLQPFHDSGLDGFDIGQAEEGPGLSRRALNVNLDGCLHGRVALQSLDGAAFRSERGGRQGPAAMPGLPWLAGSAMKLYTESQVRSKI